MEQCPSPVGSKAARRRRAYLRREPLNQPTAVILKRVPQTIVQAILLALPEFNHAGFDAIAAPVRRARDMVTEFRTEVVEALVERPATLNRSALL